MHQALQHIEDSEDRSEGTLLLQPHVLPALCRLLAQTHLKALASWPSSAGGGSAGVQALLAAVTSLLYTPFSLSRTPNAVLLKLQQVMPPFK